MQSLAELAAHLSCVFRTRCWLMKVLCFYGFCDTLKDLSQTIAECVFLECK